MAEEDLTFDVPVMSVPHGQQQSQACNCTDICHSETGNCALNKCIFFQNLLFHGPKYPVKMTRDSNCTHDVLVKKKKEKWNEYTSTLLSGHPQRPDIYRLKAHRTST